jgi:ADP-heptose:LPS heptosyltransferase
LVCKPEKERREEAKKITFGFNQILKSRQETNHIGQQLEELDKELIDLIQHHPDKDLIEQFYFRSVPFDKQERRLEKRQNNLSVEDKAARERLRSELNNKIQINREKHKTIANKLDSPSFISTIQKIKKEAQKIVDLGGAGEKQKIAKKILENLPLLETCSDNEDIEDIFVLCCQKIPKEYVADLLKRRWKELSNPREVEARQEAWEKILPVYDKLASAFWDYFKAEGVNLRPSS